ncbi:uncharacterized protein Ecym_6261 [Eremothecium cymbalariae DBVPG|uniref:Uncharacterized protein n=1 Tax=Eremothecium cymbalariae (strain CBS 270.75 / DBVPG 7215 / KCTC 17166 / NRRL Y-17582) TaxID=931890 RepID=G8JVG4_ERECY|nr:hypothetical protein Ecym_6261 [Eremothecium cymbalariae DBVPG\
MHPSPTKGNHSLYLLPVSFVSGIIVSWLIRSNYQTVTPSSITHSLPKFQLPINTLGYDDLRECIKSTSLPLQYCYDGFSGSTIFEAHVGFGKDTGEQYKECISNVGYLINSNEDMSKDKVLMSVENCIKGAQYTPEWIVKPASQRSRLLLGRIFKKTYEFFKFLVVLSILGFQGYLFSESYLSKHKDLEDYESLPQAQAQTETKTEEKQRTQNVLHQKEKKPSEVHKNRKSPVKVDIQAKPRAMPAVESENTVPEDNTTAAIAKHTVQSHGNLPSLQSLPKNSLVATQSKNRVIINCKEKGLVFDMTTKEGVQKWRDYVNRGKSHPSPIEEKAMVPTQVCLTPIPNPPVDFSRISLYDHNGKAFRRIFVPGLGWITRDRCIQLMQEQGYKENQARGLDY